MTTDFSTASLRALFVLTRTLEIVLLIYARLVDLAQVDLNRS